MTNREYITRALLSLLPPGAFKTTEDSHVWNLAFAFAAVIEPAYDNAVKLGNEALPHSAEQMLAEWEKLFNQPSMAGATTAQRQAALVAFWRWAIPPTIPGIRQVLAPPLNPTHQFRDLCDDEDVSWRFETDLGNGVIQEVAGADLQLEATGAADCRWGFGHQRASLDVIDRDDDYWLEVLLEAPTLNADGGGGLPARDRADGPHRAPRAAGGPSP